jgi:uncharacterized repeat protein (TIGR01451 family)
MLGLGSAGVAQAQNILILTTGDRNDRPADPENNYMTGIIQEFAAPLTLATCSNTPQTVTDPVTGLSKTVTCNSTELVNSAPLNPSALFAPGYDLVVIASAYSTIDASDWPQLESAIASRSIRGAVLFIDTVNNVNANQVRPLLQRSLNSPAPTLGNGAALSGVNAHALNTAATGAGDFTDLASLSMSVGYYPYTNVPYANALYLATGSGPVSSGVTSAVGVLVPSATSFAGGGACIFGANDIGWANPVNPAASGWAANQGKVGTAFLKSFNNPIGPCAAAIANPPELDIAKHTSAGTDALPFNGSTVPYTVTVSNTSSAMANNVALTDIAPAALSFGQWSCTVINPGAAPASACPTVLPSGDLSATFNLSAGAELAFTVNATVLDNQRTLTNTATLGLPAGATCAGGRTPCDASVVFSPLPAVLEITKTTNANTQALPANGSTVPYTVTVSNTSAGAASGVTLSDTVPAGMSFGTWSCTALNAGSGQASTCPATLPSGALSTILDLSAGAQLQFSVNATVLDNQQALTNTAALTLPAGATCAADRTPCDATVRFNAPPVVDGTLKAVPSLGFAGLGLLGSVLALLAFGMRRSIRSH